MHHNERGVIDESIQGVERLQMGCMSTGVADLSGGSENQRAPPKAAVRNSQNSALQDCPLHKTFLTLG